VFALSGLGGENEVSGVKWGRLNKKVWETLAYVKGEGIFESEVSMDRIRIG